MNRISTSQFEQLPLELYTKMIGGIDNDLPIEDLDRHRRAAQETLRSWVTLAMVSHQLFTNVMHALHDSTIFKSLVSPLKEDRESFSLYRAFRPSVDFVKNTSTPNGDIILFNQGDQDLQNRVQSFFDIFWRIFIFHWQKTQSNIVQLTPRFLFELILKKCCTQNAVSVLRAHYKNTLAAYLTALETLSMTPPNGNQDTTDREKIIKAIRYCPERLLELSPASLSNDAEYSFEYHLATEKIDEFLHLFEDKREDESFALKAVRDDGAHLQKFPNFNNNKKVVLTAVQNNGVALQYAHEDLKQNKNIVRAAVHAKWQALQYAHEDLKQDREIVLEAVRQNGLALLYAHKDFKKNRDIVLTAVQQNGMALLYADESLKRNEAIVFAAVREDGMALQYADESLKQNETIVFAAVQQDGMALQYANASCKQNEAIVLTAISQNPLALRHVLDLKDNREFILKAMNTNHCVFYHLNEEMQQDPEIIAIFNKNRRIWETEISSAH